MKHRAPADTDYHMPLLHNFSDGLRFALAKPRLALGGEYLDDRPTCSLGDQFIGIDALAAEQAR